ncbi:hypothetical protein [Mesorhizobium sp. M8A.F.Ca.ET.165.01.1.1]|uniref:hypothetical protein n=1 Tax=Mesorhizobium sp. M8A.F.Ca.ET.165.01.1.1 TaxID=2563960 RepID=UPI0016768D26|nr:hypothetical protein [Mesorhizobium sp. M8A.F.Ca.ET.165.01.1.1]
MHPRDRGTGSDVFPKPNQGFEQPFALSDHITFVGANIHQLRKDYRWWSFRLRYPDMRKQSVQTLPAKFKRRNAQFGRPAILPADSHDVLPQHRRIYSHFHAHRLEPKQHAVVSSECCGEIHPPLITGGVTGDDKKRGRQKMDPTTMKIGGIVSAC